MSAGLFDMLPARAENTGALMIGVTATVPPHLVGAGAGLTSEGGSLHIQSTDRKELAKHGLDKLRLGDVVAIADTDSRYNHGYRRGAMAIGIVGQTDGPRAGYGPGMTVVMTAIDGALGAFAAPGTNIADIDGPEAVNGHVPMTRVDRDSLRTFVAEGFADAGPDRGRRGYFRRRADVFRTALSPRTGAGGVPPDALQGADRAMARSTPARPGASSRKARPWRWSTRITASARWLRPRRCDWRSGRRKRAVSAR